MNYYNYFTEIEETFIRRRGKNLLLSPLDWALIESWQEREVPLHIVLRGIERVFDTIDKQPARKRSVKSLFYCKEEIEAQFAEWLESQIGASAPVNGNGAAAYEDDGAEFETDKASEGADETKGELFSRAAIKAHLEKVSGELAEGAAASSENAALREAFERVLSRLGQLGENYESAEKLEESLEKLDALVDEVLLKYSDADAARRETEKNLAAYRHKMETEAFQRTFDLMMLKKLREERNLPRLSLFYL